MNDTTLGPEVVDVFELSCGCVYHHTTQMKTRRPVAGTHYPCIRHGIERIDTVSTPQADTTHTVRCKAYFQGDGNPLRWECEGHFLDPVESRGVFGPDSEVVFEEESAEPADDWRVHAAHCCPVHGCKYGDDGCLIANKDMKPTYGKNNGCELCDMDDAATFEDRITIRTVLEEHRDRLMRAEIRLMDLVHASHTDAEAARLKAKRSGVALARSYVEEEIRMMGED